MATFRNATLVAVFCATSLHAADLRPIKDPAKVTSVFPSTAKLRVLNVWATWCAPCVAEMPELRAADAAFGVEVAFVGISFDDMLPESTPKPVAAFLDAQKISYPNLYYTGNADALGERLHITGEIPITIVYDRAGHELWRHQGPIERNAFIARLRDLLRRTS
jgi:thiol-disulfide isomerase/thioredoxin